MKFLVTWSLHEDTRHEVLSMFAQMPADQEKQMLGDNIKIIGRWHDLVGGQGVAIFESDSIEAISAYSLNWNKYMDLDIVPVLDDDETREIGKKFSS